MVVVCKHTMLHFTLC